jgi:hypothetical protein
MFGPTRSAITTRSLSLSPVLPGLFLLNLLLLPPRGE